MFFILCVYGLWVVTIIALSKTNLITLKEPLDFLKISDSTNDHQLNLPFIISIFSYLASLTSTIGVAIGLRDFIADLLKNTFHKTKSYQILPPLLTLIPALVINLVAQNSFMLILQWASLFGLYILVILPSWIHFKIEGKLQCIGTAIVGITLVLPIFFSS